MSTGTRGYTDAEIVTIEQWLKEGGSAATIAAKFSSAIRDVSRNAIIGIVHRDEKLKAIGFARARSAMPGAGRPSKNKARGSTTLPKAPAPYTLPATLFLRALDDADRDGNAFQHQTPSPRRMRPGDVFQTVGMRFVDCLFDRCRWPVDMSLDAPATSQSLVCGMPVGKFESYCQCHQARLVRNKEAA